MKPVLRLMLRLARWQRRHFREPDARAIADLAIAELERALDA